MPHIEMNPTQRLAALTSAIQQADKRFGKGSVMRLGDREAAEVEVVSSGCKSLDGALGVQGYPRGRVIEIFGPESSGKTTLTLHAIAEMQRAGGTCAFIDAEHALDIRYARDLGVDVDNLYCAQPDSGEAALEIAETLVRSGSVDMVVIDSVAALVPRAEIEGEMGDHHVGLQARLMSQALRKITAITARTGCIVIFINQIRQKIGVMFGNGEVTTGGNALKFYASIRVEIRRIGAIKDRDVLVGNKTRIKIVKNKLAPPFRSVEVEILYGRGVCRAGELMMLGETHGLVTRSGSWYHFGEVSLGQGRERSREALKADPALLAQLEAAIDAHLGLAEAPVAEAK